MKIQTKISQQGQALLTLIVFVFISITITSAAAASVLSSIFSASETEQGVVALYAGESGIENALLKFLRNPNYTGDTISINQASVTSTVVGNPPTITAVSKYQNVLRTVQIQTVYNNNALVITSWKEIN